MRRKANFEKVVFLGALIFAAAGCVPMENENANISASATPVAQTSPVFTPSPIVSPTPTIAPSPTPTVEASPSPTIGLPADEPAPRDEKTAVVTSSATLMIPVVGVKPTQLRDTFKDARSEGRVHDAIDIMAAAGTPVVAAVDGKIIKFFDSVRGGITIYQLGTDNATVYYYAHLQKRADALKEGDFVRQGTLLGYVGDTGNAGAGNNHLHFAIWTTADPKRFYDGVNVNPYPLLMQGVMAQQK